MGILIFFLVVFTRIGFLDIIATFAQFTYNDATDIYTISRLEDGFGYDEFDNNAYPIFWRKAGRTNGLTNLPFGYAHHFAEVGSRTSTCRNI